MKAVAAIKKTAISTLLAALLLSACGGDKPEAMLASAKDYLAKGDRNAAIIQIKNALQNNPGNADARVLLGRTLLDGGDPVAAEVELRKALELKASSEQVTPMLARALVMAGQYKKVTDDLANVSISDPASRAELKTSVGIAYAAIGQLPPAEKAFAEALSAQPDYGPAKLAQARLQVAARDLDGAIRLVDEVLAKNDKDIEALKLKGDFLRVQGNADGAVEHYRKALVVDPSFMAARGALLVALMQMNKLDEADKEIVEMRKVAGKAAQTVFLDAQLAYLKKDYTYAREQIQGLLRVAPENISVMQLAGAVEFQSGALLQAENYLSKVVAVAPQLPLARRLLIATYLRTGQPAKAASVIEPILEIIDKDANMLSLAGEVFVQNGDFARAEKMFEKASQLDPKDGRKRTSLALTHLVKGDDAGAFEELHSIASSDAGNTADLALISAYLRKGEIDKAIKAIDGLIAKQADNPLGPTLKGRALIAKRDIAGARKSFEKALSLKPTYYPAAASLASLDLAEKKTDDARKRFESILAADPKNGQALMALAELTAKTGGKTEEVAAALDRAMKANPTDPAPRLVTVDLYLRAGDAKKAVAVAQQALAALPDHPAVMSALGRAFMASGEINQAISTFGKLAQQQPNSPQPQLLLAEAHMAAKDTAAAEQALKKGLEIKPDFLEAQRALIMLGLGSGNADRALSLAKDVQKQRPADAVGHALEGDIGVTQKNWTTAANAYRAGLKKSPTTEVAIKLHSVLVADNKASEADKFSASWLKEHPKDLAFRFHLGDEALRAKNLPLAASIYKAILELQPNNPGALNNLAWVTGELKGAGAVEYAEKANLIAPNQPLFMDTLAMLVAAKGDTARALDLLQKALALQPNAQGVRLNYARVLIQAGDKAKAKQELATLAALGDKFPAQDEVAKLSKGL